MEIAVELDDALIGARLFPDGGIGNGELILDADVALLLVLLFVAREALHDLGLADHLFGKVVERKIVLLPEVFHRLVEHLGLVGLRHVELRGKMPGHVFLAHGQDVVRVVVVVLPRADMQEIVDPVTRFRPVGVVHDADGEAFFALGIEHEAPFVQFVDVDSLAGGDMQLPVLLPDLEERIAGLGLEKPDGIDRLAPETAAGEIDDVKFAALDLRVCARLVKVPGKAHGVVVERCRCTGSSS